MSDVAAIIADLVRAGVDPDLVGRTAAALAQNVQIVQNVQDPVAEKRRAYDRDRKASKRNSTGIPPESAEPSSPEVSPYTPLPNPSNHIPPSPPKGGSSPTDFERWYQHYPHKVGRGQAERAFPKALSLAGSLDTLIAATRAYAAKTDDRPWKNPATWLNGKCWLDAPAPSPTQRSTAPPKRREDPFAAVSELFNGNHNEPSLTHRNREDAERLSAERGEREGAVVDLRRRPDGSFGPSHPRDGSAVPTI